MHTQGNCCEAIAATDGYVYSHAAARITKLSMRTVRHYAHIGRIPAIRSGRRCWKFRLRDLFAFNERRSLLSGFAVWWIRIPCGLSARLQAKSGGYPSLLGDPWKRLLFAATSVTGEAEN